MTFWGLGSKRFRVTAVSLGLVSLAGLCGCRTSHHKCECGCASVCSSDYIQSPAASSTAPHAPTAETPPTVEGVADGDAHPQTAVAARFEAMGGKVEFDGENRITVLDLSNARATDGDLRGGTELQYLSQLDLSNTQITNATLVGGSWMRNLQRLSLNHTQITDAGLKGLQGLSQLRLLWLNQTSISDDGLSYLADLTNLESLGLNETRVTNLGLMHLRGMQNLKYLLLSHTEISDEGLLHLTGLRSLKGLSLVGTKVTAEGVAALRQDLPGCEIVSDADKAAAETEEEADDSSEVTTSGYHVTAEFDDDFEQETVWGASRNPLPSSDADITRFYIGLAYAQTGDINAALSLFTETVGAAAAHYNLGVLLCEAGNQLDGKEHFRMALVIDPDLPIDQEQLETVLSEKASSDQLSSIGGERQPRPPRLRAID